MSITIGDNNTISKSNISTNQETNLEKKNNSWITKHPIISSIVITVIASFIMMFSFWGSIVNFIEKLTGG